MPSYGWTMVAKIVHQLKLLQLFRFDDRIPSMARVITIYQKHMTKQQLHQFPMDSFQRGVPASQFHNCNPSVTKDIKIYQSDMTALSWRYEYICFIQSKESSPKALIISCQWPFSGSNQKFKCQPPWLVDEGNFSILNGNSYLEML